ncbi:HEPN domain-containing protein [Clostridium sp. AWRP]|uniref:HEPN domain-containing protein n=1 Tax=Clostridium sp. AWRP TaxID=2212991 RepID=UPI000FDA7161|nr:HEPN domain-containing protein [Clostridium sp. AWRP]AZV56765.1 hypothetical protein DMR38_09220 [Clostridium sp. AWRP]
MNYEKILYLIKKIKSSSKYNVNFNNKPDHDTVPICTMPGKELVLQDKEKAKNYNKIINKIWENCTELWDTVSLETIENEIIKVIIQSFENKTEIEIEDLKKIFKYLLSLKNENWTAFRQIYGIKMNSVKPLQFGDFTIYNLDNHKRILDQQYPNANLESNNSNKYFIKVMVKARDGEKAKILANRKFVQFENIIRFMIKDISHYYNVAIFNYMHPSYEYARMLCDDGCTISDMRLNTTRSRKVDLEESYLINNEFGNKKIWEIAKKNNNSEIEKRLLVAIEWIGKGLNDLDEGKAFIQFIFAIEALLQLNKGGIVSPSIASQISEYASFIIGSKLEERIDIEKTFKDLYSKRSDIAHGRSQSVSEEDLKTAFLMARDLIVKILTLPDFQNIKSIQDIQEWVKNKKYS